MEVRRDALQSIWSPGLVLGQFAECCRLIWVQVALKNGMNEHVALWDRWKEKAISLRYVIQVHVIMENIFRPNTRM